MNAPKDFEERIQRRLDGENGALHYENERQPLTPEEQQYAETMERLVNRLDAIETPLPPAGMVDDVMAFIEKQEAASAQPQAPKESLGAWLQRLTYQAIPTFEMPQVLRREGWSVAVAAFVIAWFGWLYPQIESSNPETLLQPITQEMVSFADQVQAKSLQITDSIENFANQIVEPILKNQTPADTDAQSEASQPYDRKLTMPSHRLEYALQYA